VYWRLGISSRPTAKRITVLTFVADTDDACKTSRSDCGQSTATSTAANRACGHGSTTSQLQSYVSPILLTLKCLGITKY